MLKKFERLKNSRTKTYKLIEQRLYNTKEREREKGLFKTIQITLSED